MKLKPIAGYEGIYSIREDGMVRAHDRIAVNGSLQKAKWIKPSNNGNGYLIVKLMKNGVRATHTVHKLCATAFVPNPDNLPQVNHLDKDRMNNHHSNFEWVTHTENMQHAHSREFKVVSPSGNNFIGTNINEFARQHDLNPTLLSALVRGKAKQHKGWTKWAE